MYRTQSPDTDPRVEKVLCDLAARMTAAEKMAAMKSMWRLHMRLSVSGLRIRYPEAGNEEIRKRLCAILHGRDISMRVFGWDPELEGY